MLPGRAVKTNQDGRAGSWAANVGKSELAAFFAGSRGAVSGAVAPGEFARGGKAVGEPVDRRKFMVEGNFSEKGQSKLVHHGRSGLRKHVNNQREQDKRMADFIGVFVLSTRSPPGPAGEQPVHINSLSNG